VADLPIHVPHFVKISLCRFIQEGLNNAFRHAAGKGQRVSAHLQGDLIVVEVADEGPGMSVQNEESDRVRLGLIGLWDRIESLGGSLQVKSRPGAGTRLIAHMPMSTGG
jgi:signal transduction histidine kinase